MDKQDIINSYEKLTSTINKLNTDIKADSLEVGKAYSIFINLVHDLNTYLTLKQEEKKIAEKELSEVKLFLTTKKEELKALIKKGNEEINKQKDDFERIKKSEIERLFILNKQAEEKTQFAEKILSEARQKNAEINEKIEKFKQEEVKFIETKKEAEKQNNDLTKREEVLKIQFMSLQNQQSQIKIDLGNTIKNRQYISEKEESVKTALEEIKIQNKLLETTLSNFAGEKNNLLILKSQLEKKEEELKNLQKSLIDFQKQLDDKEKNLNAYKEEIDYKMALERQKLEKQKRELVLKR